MKKGTGFLACQKLDAKQGGFRIAATGTVLHQDYTAKVQKKLKLVGYPMKIYKNTAFVKVTFSVRARFKVIIGYVHFTTRSNQIRRRSSKDSIWNSWHYKKGAESARGHSENIIRRSNLSLWYYHLSNVDSSSRFVLFIPVYLNVKIKYPIYIYLWQIYSSQRMKNTIG